jgi:hypothetical protein
VVVGMTPPKGEIVVIGDGVPSLYDFLVFSTVGADVVRKSLDNPDEIWKRFGAHATTIDRQE